MALIDKASLLMVPSTYEDGTLYNVLPSGNKAPDETGNNNGYDQTRADFTFDRGNNLAATRVNADGLIEKGRENVFKHSNAFTTSPWSMGATLTSGQTDKDGGTDAWLFEKSGASNSDYYNDTTINGVQTFSIYVKKQSGVGIKPYFFGSVNGYATINLEDGSKFDASGAIIDYKAEAYNDNWWRVSVTINASSGNWYIYVTDGTNTQTTTPITIQSAQLEKGLVATTYLDSGATTAKAGILEDMPRIDYTSGTGALLLEGLRTNVLPQSEYYGGSEWTKTNIAVTTNAATSPEGLQNASLVYPTASSSTKWGVKIEETATGLTNSAYTNSVYLKSNGWQWVYLIDPSGLKSVWFDLVNGVVGTEEANATGDIEPMGDGWYKCTIYTHSATTTYVYAGVYFSDADNSYVCTASGTNGVYMYGFQSEAGNYVSSYIPSYGSAVTRSADDCEISTLNSGILGTGKGSFYLEGYVNTLDGNGIIPLTAGTSIQNLFYIWIRTSGTLQIEWYQGGGLQASLQTSADTLNVGDSFKIGVAYQNNDFVAYLDGNQIAFDSSGTAPNPTSLQLGQYTSGAYKGGALHKTIVFPTRLTNTELAALTA